MLHYWTVRSHGRILIQSCLCVYLAPCRVVFLNALSGYLVHNMVMYLILFMCVVYLTKKNNDFLCFTNIIISFPTTVNSFESSSSLWMYWYEMCSCVCYLWVKCNSYTLYSMYFHHIVIFYCHQKLSRGCTSPRRQVALVTESCIMALNICGSCHMSSLWCQQFLRGGSSIYGKFFSPLN